MLSGPRESRSSKHHLNENESSSSNSSPITQSWEPLNQVPPETKWKLVEHKRDDSHTLECESGSMRKADDTRGTNRSPHGKDPPLLIDTDSGVNNQGRRVGSILC